MSAPERRPGINHGLLHFFTCGSVDDGKSTLIGRLLYDTKTMFADTLHAIERTRGIAGWKRWPYLYLQMAYRRNENRASLLM